ncbi:MAG: response regulator, partial [Myxococcales bacterium]|nr:response regulator [Myxococcales bacterium]
AHDFNNMLSVIITEVFLLRAMQPETTPELEELSIILETAERAASLTRGLLAFSRRQILRPRPLVLTDVVRRMEGIVLRTLGEEIEYEFQTRDELWKVYADANQLEQVLLNLCINARDAMPKGGRLVVTTRNYTLAGDRSEPEAQLPSGDYVELAVTDTGAGIPAEIVDKIFEPFFSTKAPGKGTGLGLAVAHGVVSQSGGFMLVDTSPGEGTTFRILLPRHDGVDTPPADADPDEPLPHGRETILLVEDDDAVRESVRKLLERTGYTVLEAEHGEAALAVLRRAPEPPELVISDVIMPRMGGVELAARLRELAPTIKLLFVSGYNDLAVERCGELVEHARLLLKPFTPHELLHAVRAALQPPPPDERA